MDQLQRVVHSKAHNNLSTNIIDIINILCKAEPFFILTEYKSFYKYCRLLTRCMNVVHALSFHEICTYSNNGSINRSTESVIHKNGNRWRSHSQCI